jgi:hypothetical protein
MRPIAILLSLAPALLCQAQSTIDLDAPAVKKITIKSELERGQSAMFDCGLNASHTSTFELAKCPFQILDQNKQKNTDTDAFTLGVAFYAWVDLTTIIDVIEKLPDREQRGYSEGISNASLWFKIYKDKAATIGIDDHKLCEVLKLNYDLLKPRLESWSSKTSNGTTLNAQKRYQAGIRFMPENKSLHVLLVDKEGPNVQLLNMYIVAIDGKHGTGLELQSELASTISKHQDGSPIKISITKEPNGPEEETTIGLFQK